ncbi:MAG TPA: ABC transporter permease subunit [Candidatus Limnocylindria bacterium]|nr:ABC transporter permease subunit [Candidatus Limnocylindria bacterium]
MTATTLPRQRRSGVREFGTSVVTIMSKELRSRFRGRRAFIILTLYLAVLALIAYGAYVGAVADATTRQTFGPDGSAVGVANRSAIVGQAIFALLSVFQLMLVAFLAPAFTTGAISLEREKATLDLLMTTPLRPGAIVVGKLLSALAFVVLMILAGIPVSALVLMYGGASVEDIIRAQVVLLVAAVGFGVIGLFCSALIKRTQGATVIAYSTVLFLTVGTFFVWRLWTAGLGGTTDGAFGVTSRAPEELLYLNPAIAMVEIVADTEITRGDMGTIMAEIRGTSGGIECEGDVCFTTDGGAVPVKGEPAVVNDCGPNERCAAPPVAAVFDPPLTETGHFLPRFALAFAGLSLLLTIASMRLVVPAGLGFNLRRRRAVPAVETQP